MEKWLAIHWFLYYYYNKHYDTQSFHNMDDFTLVFYANNNYSVTKIQELYDSWTYGN